MIKNTWRTKEREGKHPKSKAKTYFLKAVEMEADLSSVFASSFEKNPKPLEVDVFAGGLLLAGPMLRHSGPPLPAPPEMDTLISG